MNYKKIVIDKKLFLSLLLIIILLLFINYHDNEVSDVKYIVLYHYLLIKETVFVAVMLSYVLPGSGDPFGTNMICIPSSLFASPAVPDASPFFAHDSQPNDCACTR